MQFNKAVCELSLPKCLLDIPHYVDTINLITEMNRSNILQVTMVGSKPKAAWVGLLASNAANLTHLYLSLRLNPSIFNTDDGMSEAMACFDVCQLSGVKEYEVYFL